MLHFEDSIFTIGTSLLNFLKHSFDFRLIKKYIAAAKYNRPQVLLPPPCTHYHTLAQD